MKPSLPLWMRLLRLYARNSPVARGQYRVAHWCHEHLTVPAVGVDTTLDNTLRVGLRLDNWAEYNAYCLGLYESYLAHFFIGQLRLNSVVLDVGALFGQYTLLAAKYAPQGRVLAFEPSPTSRQRLEEHIRRNRLANVAVVPAAVSDKPGRAQFQLSADAGNNGLVRGDRTTIARETIEVAVTTIDAAVEQAGLPRVDMIKMDVEGAEWLALQGAYATLRQYQPLLLVEIERAGQEQLGGTPEQLGSYLRDLGYQLYRLDRSRLVPLDESRVVYENVIAIAGTPPR